MCASNKFAFKFGVYADPTAMTLHVPYISVGVDVMQMGWHTRMILILINSTVSVSRGSMMWRILVRDVPNKKNVQNNN